MQPASGLASPRRVLGFLPARACDCERPLRWIVRGDFRGGFFRRRRGSRAERHPAWVDDRESDEFQLVEQGPTPPRQGTPGRPGSEHPRGTVHDSWRSPGRRSVGFGGGDETGDLLPTNGVDRCPGQGHTAGGWFVERGAHLTLAAQVWIALPRSPSFLLGRNVGHFQTRP